MIEQSAFDREFDKLSEQSQSMVAEYKDIMSSDLDEGPCSVDVKQLTPKKNQLSTLSPSTVGYMSDGGFNIDGGDFNNNRLLLKDRGRIRSQLSFNYNKQL